MIIILELIDEGTGHAVGNSQWAQVIARAAPGQMLRILAPPVHLAALQQYSGLGDRANVTFGALPVIQHHRLDINVASALRFREEFGILRDAIAAAPRGEPCLVVLAQAAPTAALAALLAGKLLRRDVSVQMVLHGSANAVEGWRSRNPLARRFDLRGVMERPPNGLRFIVLERAIAAELGRIAPAIADRIDVLPLPVNAHEIDAVPATAFGTPIRVALVGQTTAAKGIGPFLATARLFKERYGDAIEFHVVGRRFPGTDAAELDVLARAIPDAFLTRADFLERLAPMHYVFLPLAPSYYRLSASGALIDAITWLKPVIASDIPICRDAFRDGGDIGFLCDDVTGMQDALHGIMQNPDAARYARQVEALRALRNRRLPQALVGTYTDILRAHHPTLLTQRP